MRLGCSLAATLSFAIQSDEDVCLLSMMSTSVLPLRPSHCVHVIADKLAAAAVQQVFSGTTHAVMYAVPPKKPPPA